MTAVTELDWQDSGDGGLIARAGAASYLMWSESVMPDIQKWRVYATHVEAEPDENGDTTLMYLGWGHDVDDAKALAQLVVDAPLGDDSARLEWMRRHNRELADEVAR